MKSQSSEPDEHIGSVHCCGRAGYSIRVSRQAIGDRNLRGHGTVADRLIRERLSSHPTAALQPSARSFSSTSFPSSSSSNPATSLFISLILHSGGLQIVVLPQQQILLNDVITIHQKFRCDTLNSLQGQGDDYHRPYHHYHGNVRVFDFRECFSWFYLRQTHPITRGQRKPSLKHIWHISYACSHFIIRSLQNAIRQ